MPYAPKRFCNCAPNCPHRVGKQKRQSSYAQGYTKRWASYSRARLNRERWCVRCGKPAQCTDHRIPVSGTDDPLFWDETNHDSLCWSCHSIKTATEDGGFSGSRVRPRGHA